MRHTFMIVFLLSMLLAFMACRKEKTSNLSPQVQQQVAFLPSDADVLGFIDIQAMQKSRFFDFITDSLEAELHRDKDFRALMDELGLDPQKDIQRMYFAARYEGKDKFKALLVTEGDFQPRKILAKIEEETDYEKVEKTTYADYELYLLPKDKAFAFTDNRHLIAGSEQYVKNYLTRLSDSPPAITPRLKKRLEKLPYLSQAWLLAKIDQWTKKIEQNNGHPKLKGLSSLQQLDFSLELNEQLRFFIRGIFDDKEKCQLFQEALKGFVAAGKLAVSDDRSIVDVLNKIDIQNNGLNLEVRFKINRDDFQKLLDRKKTLATKI